MMKSASLRALAIALPLVIGAAAPALADQQSTDGTSNYSESCQGRDSYGKSNDGERYQDRDSYRDNNAYPSNWGRGEVLSPSQIEYRLERRGYRNVHNVSYSRWQKQYHADARDYRGNSVRLSVSPFSAQVLHTQYVGYGHADRVMPFWRVERMLESRGFHAVQQLGTFGNRYRVEARDSRGRYVRLIVDARTGTIIGQRVADYGRRWSDREYSWN